MADMNTKYDALFTPWKIGNLEIKNRIVMRPMGGTSFFGWFELTGCGFDKEAAILLSKRGHKVTLYEKSDRLGGVFVAATMERQPACMLFSKPIDSLACAGAVLASVWLDNVNKPVIDNLGDEFLNYVKTGMTVTVGEDGVVTVE